MRNCRTSFWEADDCLPVVRDSLATGSTDQLVGGAIGFVGERQESVHFNGGQSVLWQESYFGILVRHRFHWAGQMPIGVLLSRETA